MSEQNSIFILQDSTLVKEETLIYPDYHSIKIEGITTYQNDEHTGDITLESSNINAINVHENKKEIPDSNTGIQNTILNLEEDLVKEEMYIKQEILSDDDNNKIYHTENVRVDNNRSDNITINTFNVYKEIKTEDDCTDYSIQNSKFYIEDGYSVKNENVSSINDENTTSKNNYDNNLSYNYENITLESSNINAINVHENKKEIPDSNTGIQNTILNLEDDLVKEEMYIKQEILSDDDNNKIYHTENVRVDNNRSDNITINTFNVYKEIKTEDDCTDYSIQNSKFYIEDGYSVKNENVSSINDENTTSKNNYDNNLSYNYENITLESSNINAINVHENKKEIPDSNTGIQNTILNLEEDLVKEEMYIKQEILSDDDNNKIYHTENVRVDNNRSDNITINTFNVYKEIKTEDDCTDYSIQNSKFYIKDGYSVKNENVSSINDENTTSKNNYDNNLSYNYENLFTKVEQISTEYCNILNENIVEIKSENDYETDILETSTNVNHKNVNNDNTIQLKSISNSDKKQYQCDICKQSFVKKGVLRNHINAHHTGGNSKQCDLRQKKCTQQRSLKRHNFTHSAENPYKCNICQKAYTQKKSLKFHMLSHTGETPYKCEMCSKPFIRKDCLKMHMLTHSGDKPHKCDICQKTYIQKKSLQLHILTHTGENPHKCDICQKAYKQNRSLKIHMLTHTGDRPHKCDNCNKSFIRKNCLKIHMLTHTGEKPHKCYICNRSFIQKNYFKTHILSHTDKKPHKCDICPKSYAFRKDLKHHMKNHIKE